LGPKEFSTGKMSEGFARNAVQGWSVDNLRALSKEEVETLTPENIEELSLAQAVALSEHESWGKWASPEQKRTLRLVARSLTDAAARAAEAAARAAAEAREKEALARARESKSVWEWCDGPDPRIIALITSSGKRKTEDRESAEDDSDAEDDDDDAEDDDGGGQKRKSQRTGATSKRTSKKSYRNETVLEETLSDSSKTTSVPIKFEPEFLKAWPDFADEDYLENEGAVFKKIVDEREGLPRFNEEFSVYREESIHFALGFMWVYVARMLNICIPSEDGVVFRPNAAVPCVDPPKTERIADLVLETNEVCVFPIVLVGEVKTTAALDTDVLETYTKDGYTFVAKADNAAPYKTMVKCALTQLCMYLTLFGGIQYGFISSYDRTYFCKLIREERDGREQAGVLISPPFFNTSDEWFTLEQLGVKAYRRNKNPCKWTLAQGFLRIAQLAIRDWRKAGGVERDNKKPMVLWKKRFAVPKYWNLVIGKMVPRAKRRGNRLASYITEMSADGETVGESLPLVVSYQPGNVRRVLGGVGLGFLHQIIAGQDCFVKVAVAADAEKYVRYEARVYKALAELWGHAVPSLVFEGDTSIGYAIVVTNEGESLQSRAGRSVLLRNPEQVRANALKALRKIHKSGWLHNDVAPRNIIVSPDGTTVRFVDLESAKRLPDDPDQEYVARTQELNEVVVGLHALFKASERPHHNHQLVRPTFAAGGT